MPTNMNVPVATIDRSDRRLIPQTPCPLVHPPETLVPHPTKRPASAVVATPGRTSAISDSGRRTAKVAPPARSPAKNSARQVTSSRCCEKRPARMPLMPAMRPLTAKRNEAAAPMSAPPKRATPTAEAGGTTMVMSRILDRCPASSKGRQSSEAEQRRSGARMPRLPPRLGAVDVKMIVVIGAGFRADHVGETAVLAQGAEDAAQEKALLVGRFLSGPVVAGHVDHATLARSESPDVDGVAERVLAQLPAVWTANVATAVGAEGRHALDLGAEVRRGLILNGALDASQLERQGTVDLQRRRIDNAGRSLLHQNTVRNAAPVRVGRRLIGQGAKARAELGQFLPAEPAVDRSQPIPLVVRAIGRK